MLVQSKIEQAHRGLIQGAEDAGTAADPPPPSIFESLTTGYAIRLPLNVHSILPHISAYSSSFQAVLVSRTVSLSTIAV